MHSAACRFFSAHAFCAFQLWPLLLPQRLAALTAVSYAFIAGCRSLCYCSALVALTSIATPLAAAIATAACRPYRCYCYSGLPLLLLQLLLLKFSIVFTAAIATAACLSYCRVLCAHSFNKYHCNLSDFEIQLQQIFENHRNLFLI